MVSAKKAIYSVWDGAIENTFAGLRVAGKHVGCGILVGGFVGPDGFGLPRDVAIGIGICAGLTGPYIAKALWSHVREVYVRFAGRPVKTTRESATFTSSSESRESNARRLLREEPKKKDTFLWDCAKAAGKTAVYVFASGYVAQQFMNGSEWRWYLGVALNAVVFGVVAVNEIRKVRLKSLRRRATEEATG